MAIGCLVCCVLHGQMILVMRGAMSSSQPSMAHPPATVASASMRSGVPLPCASKTSFPTAAAMTAISAVMTPQGIRAAAMAAPDWYPGVEDPPGPALGLIEGGAA